MNRLFALFYHMREAENKYTGVDGEYVTISFHFEVFNEMNCIE